MSPLCKITLSCFALQKQKRFLPTQWNNQVHVGGVSSLYELEYGVKVPLEYHLGKLLAALVWPALEHPSLGSNMFPFLSSLKQAEFQSWSYRTSSSAGIISHFQLP